MAIYKCKMCGGNLNVLDGDSVVVCEFCETPQTISKTNDDKILKLYARGNELRSSNEFDKAYSVFEQILSEDEKDSEAYWNLLLCKYGITYVDDYDGTKKPTMNRYSTSSILEDEDYKRCLEYADSIAKEQYIFDANQISTIQNKITNIISTEKPYDIFISYKETDEFGDRTNDSVLAQDIYNDLTKEGFRVFLSRVSLSDVIGNEYEPYIYAALYSSKIMILVTTDVEYVNSVWVKNEWSRYLTMSKNDSSKKLIPCYRGIDVYDLPKDLRNLQGVDMSKLGYLQDLKIGINKILGRNLKLETNSASQINFLDKDLVSIIAEAIKQQKESELRETKKREEQEIQEQKEKLEQKERQEQEEKKEQEQRVKKEQEFIKNQTDFEICDKSIVKYKGDQTIVSIPTFINEIGGCSFSKNTTLTEIDIPSNVLTIGLGAFDSCINLKKIKILNGLKIINAYSFCGCKNLYKIQIPQSVTYIGIGAFSECDNLDYTIFDNAKYLGNEENPYLVLINATCEDINHININRNTKIIAGGAFLNCNKLENVKIPNGVVSICENAFYNCKKLKDIDIPESVSFIEQSSFYGCKNLSITTKKYIESFNSSFNENLKSSNHCNIENNINNKDEINI